MFSSTTIASSTTRPVATISAISERLLSEKPHRYITAKLPTSGDRHRRDGIIAARKLARNSSTTRMTSPTAMNSVRSASCSVARMAGERSLATSSVDAAREERPQRRQLRRDARRRSAMMLASGWRLTTSSTAGWSLKKPRVEAVLDAVVDAGRRRDSRTGAPLR